jgi:hypothetical protein
LPSEPPQAAMSSDIRRAGDNRHSEGHGSKKFGKEGRNMIDGNGNWNLELGQGQGKDQQGFVCPPVVDQEGQVAFLNYQGDYPSDVPVSRLLG